MQILGTQLLKVLIKLEIGDDHKYGQKIIVNIIRLRKYNPSLFRCFISFGTDKTLKKKKNKNEIGIDKPNILVCMHNAVNKAKGIKFLRLKLMKLLKQQ